MGKLTPLELYRAADLLLCLAENDIEADLSDIHINPEGERLGTVDVDHKTIGRLSNNDPTIILADEGVLMYWVIITNNALRDSVTLRCHYVR